MTMNRRTFMSIAAGESALVGLAGLLAPAQLAAVFGVTLDETGIAQARLLAGAYLGYVPILWLARDVRDTTVQRGIALGSLVPWASGLVVTVAGIAAGLGTTQTWFLVALQVVFTAAWAYFAFIDRAEVSPA
jgi:hypothetical protein